MRKAYRRRDNLIVWRILIVLPSERTTIDSVRGRTLLLIPVLFIASTALACGGGSNTRQVLVDYNNQSISSIYIHYFPTSVTVHPGMTVHFKQAWNGEPHSVTLGTSVDKALAIIDPLLPQLNGNGPAPPDVQAKADAAFSDLPQMLDNNNNVVQSAAQPCFLDTGAPSQDPKTRCKQRPQPAFNGRQTYYSSGFIKYAGNSGNSFDVKLADNIKPGTYSWFCNFHGPEMQGTIVVKPKSASIPSQGSVDKKALSDSTRFAAATTKAYQQATTGPWSLLRAVQIAGFPASDHQKQVLKDGFLAGYGTQQGQGPLVTEFLPKTIHAKVGQKISWAFVGTHTVSFDVPSYFPLLTVAPNGTVQIDQRDLVPKDGPGFAANYPDSAGDLYDVDGGTWNGTGFRSSGLSPNTNNGQVPAFTIAISKPGTYQYACLIHPRMVGTVVVTA
jgi:plastocyanin